MLSFLNRFFRDRQASVITEFAAALPVLALLLLGGIEVTRYTLLYQKLDRVSSSMGDLVSQAENLTVNDLNSLFDAVQHVAWPFEFPTSGRVIITSISENNGQARINWQSAGGGALSAESSVGAPRGAATLPAGMIVRPSETVIAAEVFFEFTPMFQLFGVMTEQRLYHRSFYRPRLGALSTLG